MNAIIITAVLGVAAMLSEAVGIRKGLAAFVLLGLAAAGYTLFADWGTDVRCYNDMLWFNNRSLLYSGVILAFVFLWLLISLSAYKQNPDTHRNDHYALVLFSAVGALVLVSYSDLTMLFLGIEILSIPLYILAGSHKKNLFSNEASLKYFLMGAFATGFLLFGIALVYGAVGSFNVAAIQTYLSGNVQPPVFFYAGVLMVSAGLAFKISAVPFHFWSPDVYEGSPVLFTSFMASTAKVAALIAFYKLLTESFGPVREFWAPIVAVISAATIVTGNAVALAQRNVKRLLAYSGIAHAGYFLMIPAAGGALSDRAAFLYVVLYGLGSLAVFACVIPVMQLKNDESPNAFAGLSKEHPASAFALTLAVLSLAGIPPLAGFFAKYYAFMTALEGNLSWLVLIALGGSLAGVYYYLKMLVPAFLRPSAEPSYKPLGIFSQFLGVLLSALLVGFLFLLNFFPSIL